MFIACPGSRTLGGSAQSRIDLSKSDLSQIFDVLFTDTQTDDGAHMIELYHLHAGESGTEYIAMSSRAPDKRKHFQH